MKKLVAILLACLIFALCGVICFAEGEEPVEEVETPTEEEIPAEGEADVWYTEIVEKLTNTQFWVSIGTYLLAFLGVIGSCKLTVDKVKSGFTAVGNLLDGKASADDVKKQLTEIKEALQADYKAQLDGVNAKLAEQETNEKKLLTILTLFVTNTPGVPAPCKGEVLAVLSDVKDTAEKVEEIVEKAQEIIEEAKTETPALDKIVDDNKIVME